MMILRELRLVDAPAMLEWMQNTFVTDGLHGDYSNVSLESAESFIHKSRSTVPGQDIHMCISSDDNEYMGTVSLRHIAIDSAVAELALVVRENAMGKGYAWYGMVEMLRYAFEKLGIESVYWRVNEKNSRALRFFDKHGFERLSDIPKEIEKRHENEKNLIWYVALSGDDYENVALSRGTVADCRIVKIKTIPTIGAGELSFFQSDIDIDFDIKRVYYISKVPEGVRRGFHAHKALKQILFCPYGKIQLILENKDKREEITLGDPSIAVVIDKPIWREMLWLEKNSVLVVGASDYYDESDYIRDYDEFVKYVE